jgi:uncharacterized protein (TIGR02145 family)
MKYYYVRFLSLFFVLSLLSITSCKKDSDDSSSQVTDADGNVYHTVTIGSQTWMVENLKTTKYNDGTSITNIIDTTTWKSTTSGAYCSFLFDDTYIDSLGLLYNYYAVSSGLLAPKGWHVATNYDWEVLEAHLAANGYNYDGSTSGNYYAKSLASNSSWISSSVEGSIGDSNYSSYSNKSGFTALAGGGYKGGKSWYSHNYIGMWWTSTAYNSSKGYFYLRVLQYNKSGIITGYAISTYGLSVRCVKD